VLRALLFVQAQQRQRRIERGARVGWRQRTRGIGRIGDARGALRDFIVGGGADLREARERGVVTDAPVIRIEPRQRAPHASGRVAEMRLIRVVGL